MPSLQNFFDPKSIAIIGASENVTSLGFVINENLKDSGYAKPVYLVNPKYQQILNTPCFASIKNIPEEVELAVIVIPAKAVPEALRECAEKKVSYAIIISAGFKETGEDGARLEKEIKQIAHDANIRILGPNCLGMIVPSTKINASFAASTTKNGNVAFLSQSGAFCTAVIDWALDHNMGFSHFVSLGNKSDIDEVDLVNDWSSNNEVKVIAAYLEEINDGREFLKAVKDAKKPVVILQPGRSEEARSAMSSHTGSLSSPSRVIETAFLQANAVQVRSMQDMFNLMMALSWSNAPKGNRLAIVTNAGGPGIIATDAAKEYGMELAKLSESTMNSLKESLPPTANIHNPVDVIGDALAERFKLPLDMLAQDENVDGIVIIVTPQLVTQIEETAKLIINESKRTGKPIFTAFLGGKYSTSGRQRLFENKIPSFEYVEEAIKTMSYMYDYQKRVNKTVTQIITATDRIESTVSLITNYNSAESKAMTSDDANKLMAEFGIDIPRQAIVNMAEEAVAKAAEFGYPIVIKSASDKILHKTDLKAVYLNINNDNQLRQNFTELQENMRKIVGEGQPLPVMIQEQVHDGIEVIMGATRDGRQDVYKDGKGFLGFGHLLLFGTGGIYTEVYKDTATRLVSVSSDELKDMINETKISQILNGARGQEPMAVDKVVDTLSKINQMVLTYPEIEQIDINPAFVTKTRCIVVDFKVIVKE